MSQDLLLERLLRSEGTFFGYGEEGADTRFAEPGLRARYAPDRPFQLTHLELLLEIDPATPWLRSTAILHIKPRPAGLGVVELDLDSLVVESLESMDGGRLTWRHRDGRLRVQGLPPEGGRVRVVSAGLPARGLYFTGPTEAEPQRQSMAWTQCQDEDAHHLFPCIDHPVEKSTFHIEILAPASMTVISNGSLLGRQPEADGRHRWSWRQERRISAYLFTAVVAELEIIEEEGGAIPVRYLAPLGTQESATRRAFGRTPEMIDFLATRVGVPYPWARYDQVAVHDFIFGGMENVAATTMTDALLTDERAALDTSFDDLVVHELAHQWFGDLVTCRDWSQAWLNEGWATYIEAVWKEEDLGADEADWHRWGWLSNYISEVGARYRRPIVDHRYRAPITLFDRHLYDKGGLVLHALQSTLGADAFWLGVTQYLEAHQTGSVHTEDFRRSMEETTGRSLEAFFHQHVQSAGHAKLTVELSWEAGLLEISVVQEQIGADVPEVFDLDLPLRIVHGATAQLLSLPIRARNRTFALPCAEEPDRVEIDSRFTALAELTVKAPISLLRASLEGDGGVVGRIRAARALGKAGGRAADEALAAALASEDFWGLRAEAARALAARGGALARGALLTASRDPHPKLRRAVVDALAGLPGVEVERRLAEIAREGDPSLHVEGQALISLGKLHAKDTIALAQELLTRASWTDLLQCRALEALGHSRDPEALPLLVGWTAPQRGGRPQAAAAAALGRLAGELPEVRKAAVDALLPLAAEAPFRVRLAAVGALGAARDPRAAGPLAALHQMAGDGRLARHALESLTRLNAGTGAEQAVTALRRDVDTLREDNRALRDRLDRLTPVTEEQAGPETG